MNKDKTKYVLAWTIVLGFFGLTLALMWRPLPEGSTEVVFMLFGALAAAFGAVVQYFFGSSQGSKDKTDMLFNGKAPHDGPKPPAVP